MEEEKKYFGDPQSASGNFDDADIAIGVNQWVNCENFRVGSTDNGFTGIMESVGGAMLKSTNVSTHYFFGGALENERNRFVYVLKDKTSTDERIMCYEYDSDANYTILTNSQLSGGFGFNKDNFIHSCYAIDGKFYWTDELNNPRRINIDAGIKLNHPSYVTSEQPYVSPLAQSVLTTIRRPPAYPIYPEKILASSIPVTLNYNFVKDFAGRFTWRYWYRDYEVSVLADFSILMNRNLEGDNKDTIKITFPLEELIQQDVQKVDLIVQYADDNKCSVLNTWDKAISSDLAEINAHNSGSQALTYYFFNDIRGEALDVSYYTKIFDNVARVAKTLSFADNRQFLGNILVGYDTPTSTSLSLATVSQTGGTTGVYEWHRITAYVLGNYNGSSVYDIPQDGLRDLVYFNNVSVPGYYTPNAAVFNVPYTPPGTPTPFTDYTYYAPNIAQAATRLGDEVAAGVSFIGYTLDYYLDSIITSISVTGVTTTLIDGALIYKSGSAYRFGIVFKDDYGRHSGVCLPTNSKIGVSDRTYSNTGNFTGIQWSLNNTNALTEIPSWATKYIIVRTKNLSMLSFVEARSVNTLRYASKDINNTTSPFSYSVTYSSNAYALAIDISVLNSYGMGYVYNEGDILKLYINGAVVTYTLPVLGQDGTYVHVQLIDLTTLSGVPSIFEIYSPYKESSNESFWEVGETFPVANAGTNTRTYSAISGTVPGDIYLRNKTYNGTSNKIEFMSSNDKYWKIWNTVCSRPYFIDNIGQQYLPQMIQFSNQFIQGTKINGLSTFEVLNEKPVPLDCGKIQKLQLTSKVQEAQGSVMLAICLNETASVYLGEVQTYGANQQKSTVLISDNVIGTINVLKGSFGTINPESVIEFRGGVWWYNAMDGKIIQYGSNGLFPISNYKMTRYWKLFSEQYLSMTTSEIEALGDRRYVFMTIDPHHNELLVSVPKLLSTPPKGYLPDYPSTVYPFDVWDGDRKTLVFRLDSNPNFWQGAYRYKADGFMVLQNKMYAFKNGSLYLMNQTGIECNFFGVQEKARVMPISNKFPDTPKVYNNFSVQSNVKPTFSYFYNEYPYTQATDVLDTDDWTKDQEGVWSTNLRRNKIVPTNAGFTTDGLLTFEKMRNVAMKVMLEYSPTTTKVQLKFLTIGFSVSKGH